MAARNAFKCGASEKRSAVIYLIDSRVARCALRRLSLLNLRAARGRCFAVCPVPYTLILSLADFWKGRPEGPHRVRRVYEVNDHDAARSPRDFFVYCLI